MRSESVCRFLKWFAVLLPACAAGQTVSVDLSPPIKGSGRTIALVQLSAQHGAEPAALEWTLYGDVGKPLQIDPGEQASAAKKQITCAVHAKGRTTCVVWGLNRNVIHSGIVAKVSMPGDRMRVRLGQVSAASADGRSLAVHAPPDSGDTTGTSSFFSGFSGLVAGILLVVVFLGVYFARRLSAGRPLNKRSRASGRSASLR